MQKIVIKCQLVVIYIITFSSLYAQETPEKLAEEFFSIHREKGPIEAFENFYENNRWINLNLEQRERIKGQLLMVSENFVGELMLSKLNTKKVITPNLVTLEYYLTFDRKFIPFTLLFEKQNKDWKIGSFTFINSIKVFERYKVPATGCTAPNSQ